MREASEDLLGPRWAPKELRTFYILLKVHGEQWDKLEEHLPGRTAAMMRSLFDMHRGYLALPEASAEGFCAVMMDRYKAQYERSVAAALSLRPGSSTGDADAGQDAQSDPRAPSSDPANGGLGKRESLGNDAGSKRGEQTPNSKKKRRLEKLLSLDGGEQLEHQALEQLRIRSESDADMPEATPGEAADARVHTPSEVPGRARRVKALPRPARWWLQDSSFSDVRGKRFDLPWYCWFSSCDDDPFFHHNEFVDCLNRMGLGKIRAAARPIWSSVRLSMGHPRRLSPLFFAQEKLKLEEFRKQHRHAVMEKTRLKTWPYLRPMQLSYGTKVIVWMEMYQRFLMGTVTSSSAQEGVCTVVATTRSSDDNSEIETKLLCPLSSVMALDFLQQSVGEKDLEPPGVASLLRRSGNRKKRSQVSSAAHSSRPSTSLFNSVAVKDDGDFRENRLRSVLAVKDLLQRKEKIVSAMAKLNEQATKLQHESLKANGLDKSQLWTTLTGFSSAALKDVSWAHTGVRKALQEQHAWLAQNLHSTNKHLKAALLQLNTFTTTPETTSGSGDLSGVDETLHVDEMRWAIQFLNGSQQRAVALVDKSVPEAAAGSTAPPHTALPQTKQLISACLCLMSVLKAAERSQTTASVPSVVLHKLISRMVELLKPNHGDNMDVYAELKAMADGMQAQLAFRDATR